MRSERIREGGTIRTGIAPAVGVRLCVRVRYASLRCTSIALLAQRSPRSCLIDSTGAPSNARYVRHAIFNNGRNVAFHSAASNRDIAFYECICRMYLWVHDTVPG